MLDLAVLPSLPITARKNLPKVSAIYFCLDSTGKVLYVGRTTNLRNRWVQHHRYSQLEQLNNVSLAWFECTEEELESTELRLIDLLKPQLNWSPVAATYSTKTQRKSVNLHVKFDESLHEKLVAEADSRDITISELVRELCESGLGMRVSYKGKLMSKEEYLEYLRNFLNNQPTNSVDEKIVEELFMVGMPLFKGMSGTEFSKLLMEFAKK